MPMIDIVASLNPEQQEAVQTTEGPLLIIAGAGTGKTRTLVHRMAYLTGRKGIPAEQLLAITFTTKAAEEMRARVASLCSAGIDLAGLRIGTIHAFCYQILKNDGRRLNAVTDVKLASPTEQALIIKKLVPQFVAERAAGSFKQYALMISREKNEWAGATQAMAAHASPLLQAYQAALENEGLLDFDDLILKTLSLLNEYPSLTAQLRSRFSHISVDEYQDINNAQYQLIKQLAGSAPNLCAVGDADQAIYAFRGAQVKNFLQFQKDFPSAKIVRLEQNYRSTGTILAAAQQIIEKNAHRIDKKIVPTKSAGAQIEIHELLDDLQEARFVAREIGRLLGGTRFETIAHRHSEEDSPAKGFADIAVLYRLHAQSRLLRTTLERAGIPVQVASSCALYEEPDIELIINILAVIHNPGNDHVLGALLCALVKGLGPKTVERLRNRAREDGRSLFEMLNTSNVAAKEMAGDTRTSIDAFIHFIHAMKDKSASLPLDALVREISVTLFCRRNFSNRGNGAGVQNDDNLFDLLTAVMPFCHTAAADGIPLFLHRLALLKEGEVFTPQQEAVSLMTVHGAKGLEFPVVFIIGLEEGLFPYYMDKITAAANDPEEERRLFYVGMTRAQDKLYLTHTRSRFLSGERRNLPRSSFLEDLPGKAVCRCTDPLIEKHVEQKKKPRQMSLFENR